MNISPITSKVLIKTAFPFACCLMGFTVISMLNKAAKQSEIHEAKHEEVMKYVKMHKPDLYYEYQCQNKSVVDYYEAASKIREDLKLDSIARTNYALGMQAVRDSLASANKK